MANYSDWAAEKSVPATKLTADDKRSILTFLGGTAAVIIGLMLVGRFLHYLY